MAEPEQLSELIDETSAALTLLIETVDESEQHVQDIYTSTLDSWTALQIRLIAADEQLSTLRTAMEHIHTFLDTHADEERRRFTELAETLQGIEVSLAESGKRVDAEEEILTQRYGDTQTQLQSTFDGLVEGAEHYNTPLRQFAITMSNDEERLTEESETLDEELNDAKSSIADDIEKMLEEISETDETVQAAIAAINQALTELVDDASESSSSFTTDFKELSESVFEAIEEKFEEGFNESLQKLGDGIGGALAIVDQAMQTKVDENEEAIAALETAVDDCSTSAKAACEHVDEAFSGWGRYV